MYVFVYGTLKNGEPNFHWLTKEEHGHAEFVCKGSTSNLYPLVIASKYNIPFLLDKEGTGKNIHGEVYAIDEKMLMNLDILEEYPKLYTRREEEIRVATETCCENGDITRLPPTIKAWTYFLTDFQPSLLEKPLLESYSSEGPHNLPYVASEDDLADAKDI